MFLFILLVLSLTFSEKKTEAALSAEHQFLIKYNINNIESISLNYYKENENWCRGIIDLNEDYDLPDLASDLYFFIGEKLADGWVYYYEGEKQFKKKVKEIPDKLLSKKIKYVLSSQESTDPLLSWPFAIGEYWWLHYGVHHNLNTVNTGPFSAIDIGVIPQSAAGGRNVSNKVRAARSGFVIAKDLCNVKVRIRHVGGWYTGYFHLENIPADIKNSGLGNNELKWVARGDYLGTAEMTGSACGGGTDYPHVHLTLRKTEKENHVELKGHYIGGYYITDKNRDGNRVKRQGAIIDKNGRRLYPKITDWSADPPVLPWEYKRSDNLDIYNDGTISFYDLSILAGNLHGNYEAEMLISRQATVHPGKSATLTGSLVELQTEFRALNGSNVTIKSKNVPQRQQFNTKKIYEEIDKLIDPIPNKNQLNQNFPNPFNPSTTISFTLKKGTNVKLVIYNMLGQSVRTLANTSYEAGYHTIKWDGKNDFKQKVPSGIYIYKLTGNNFTESKRMILIK